MIPEFPNEVNPNPVTAIDLRTEQGVTLRWHFDPPVQQSRMMLALGGLFAQVSEEMPELSLPSEQEEFFAQPDRPKIICLCGSTRFKDAYVAANFRFSTEGAIVLTIGWWSQVSDRNLTLTPAEKELVDRVYLSKITLADEVFVLNVDGYIGESTANEIAHAEKLGKQIMYLEPQGFSHGPS